MAVPIRPADLPPAPGGAVAPDSSLIFDDGDGVFKATPDEVVAASLDLDAGAAKVGESHGANVQDAIDALGFMGVLSTTAALQDALDYIGENGGTLIVPPGVYAITAQLTLTPTTFNNIRILGYGVELTTSGAISALKVSDAYNLPGSIVIEGFHVNHEANGAATAGFELVHSNEVKFLNCTVEATGTFTVGDETTGADQQGVAHFVELHAVLEAQAGIADVADGLPGISEGGACTACEA